MAPTLSATRRKLVLAAVCLSLVLVVAGTTMLNVALPDLARSVLLQFLAMYGFFFIALQYLQLVQGYGSLKAALAPRPLVCRHDSEAVTSAPPDWPYQPPGSCGCRSSRSRVRTGRC